MNGQTYLETSSNYVVQLDPLNPVKTLTSLHKARIERLWDELEWQNELE